MKKIGCLLISMILLVLSSNPASGAEPTQEQIRAWMKTVQDTQFLVKSAQPYRQYTSSKELQQVRERQAAFRGLSRSRAGIIALAREWNNFKDEKPTFAQEQLMSCAVSGMAYYFKTTDMLSDEEYHDFLARCVGMPSYCYFSHLIQVTSFERLAKMQDVWLAWLDSVNPDCLAEKPNTNHKPDCALFNSACKVLQITHDPTGVKRVIEILQSAPRGIRIAEAANYLESVGASEGFRPLMRLTDGKLCADNLWDTSLLADEQQAPELYEAFQRSRAAAPGKFFFPIGNRPDLIRGMVPFLLKNPERRVKWENVCAKDYINPSWLGDLPKSAVGIFPDREILQSALDAESKGEIKVESLWIDALGRTDSNVGARDLIRWALSRPRRESRISYIPWLAARDLVRRTLGPNYKSVLSKIKRLQKQKRAKLVELMLEDIGVVSRPDGIKCGNGRYRESWRKADPSRVQMRDLLVNNQQALLRWMGWLDNPNRLVSAYALMTVPEAHRRFIKILSHANPTAIKLAWQYDLDVPQELLRNILNKPDLPIDSIMFLRLKLSESGDDSSYQALKKEMITSLASRNPPEKLYYDAILNEMSRRRDTKGIIAAWSAASSEPVPRNPLIFGNHPTGRLSQRNWIASFLLRFDTRAALDHLTDIDPTTAEGLHKVFLTAIDANSPNAETLLKKVDFNSLIDAGTKRGQMEKTADFWLAVKALKLTGTPWCREEMLKMKQWNALAELGDRRASAAVRPLGNGWTAVRVPWDVYAGGDFRKAVDEMLKIMSMRYRPSNYVDLPGTYTMPYRKCPGERLRSMEREFLKTFPTLSAVERLAAVKLLSQDRKLWTDDVLRAILSDSFAPVRLSGLISLSKSPRPELNDELKRIEKEDPFPWCRRLAHEILIFRPDPLEPHKGFRFDVPRR